jgi:isopenicillin N synthase-like dioxygenase
VGGELTSGIPDRKEGLYLGAELGPDDPRVQAGLPLHGPNLFPVRPAELGPTVLTVLDELTTLGHRLLAGIALGLGLPEQWFAAHLTADPVVLFRIFHYPPEPAGGDRSEWGVAEHTDYGLLTLLHQDAGGGLEVRSAEGSWQEVPPVEDALVCNLGDMLERMSSGRYRSTAHRVRSPGDRHRISCPFFFDPSWDAVVQPLPLAADDRPAEPGRDRGRWDGASVFEWEGTYGAYLSAKVAKVFPDLGAEVLDRPDA